MNIAKNNLILGLVLVLIAGMSIGYFIKPAPESPDVGDDFSSLSVEQMRERYMAERNIAIKQAKAEGLYDCCVEPACTMCFDRGIGGPWSLNGQYCSCDQLLAQGKEPCPQCENSLAQGLSD